MDTRERLMDDTLRDWLLGTDNPGVRVRTLTDLCGLAEDDAQVRQARESVVPWLPAARDPGWMALEGLASVYGLVALAECGLTRSDLPIEPVVDRLLSLPFDAGCGDLLTLRALVMLGYAHDPRVQARLGHAAEVQRPDGGWLCLHRVNKMDHPPKSCIKAAMHGALLAAELARRGISMAGSPALVDYFVRRRLFYRTDDPSRLVLGARPGWRTVDVFMPSEVQRVGLPMLLYALATLGAGQAPEMQEAWALLESKRDAKGRVLLEGTLAKPYLPKERVGKPSKWATLYACLAWQARERG